MNWSIQCPYGVPEILKGIRQKKKSTSQSTLVIVLSHDKAQNTPGIVSIACDIIVIDWE